MERRILIAIVLSFLVLWGYQAMFAPPPEPERGRPLQGPASGRPAQPAAKPGSGPGTTAGAPAAERAPEMAAAPVATLVGEEQERQIVVENDVLRAVFSNRGAEVLSWVLKPYRNDAGQALDLVPAGLSREMPHPFTLSVPSEDVNGRMRRALYRVQEGGGAAVRSGSQEVVFEFRDAQGLDVRKAFRFEPGFVVRYTMSVTVDGQSLNPTVLWGPGLGAQNVTNKYLQQSQGIIFRSGKVERLDVGTLREDPVYEAQFDYAGVDDHYFISVVLPERSAVIEYRPVTLPVPGATDGATRELVSYGVRVAGGPKDVRLYAGPKDFDVLKSVDGELVQTINYGIFSWLAVPLLRGLKGINAYVGNYGWSIIILTALINLAMFPLRHKSVVSMRRMQEIQPQIKAVQERYKGMKATDPARQKMNTEMMSLYREKGVNPASGCVPMLLTMPVLFAFYSLLSQAIEIRGEPFALWIQDLSTHDPYFVTPILMGITMIWQQQIMPSSMDPAQQKIMLLMPVVFSVMFLWAPSGLVLYWLVSNVLAIAQQYGTLAIIGPPQVKVPRPPAERRVKSVGSGKSEGAKG